MPDALWRFARHRLALAGAAVLVALVVLAIVGPLVWRYDHTIQPSITSDSPPSFAHPFGTSRTGHDLLGQVLRGTRQSLLVGVVAGVLATVLGGVWGAIAGYFRGAVDAVLMRIVDVVLVVPLLVVVLALAGPGGTTAVEVAAVIGLFGWLTIARIVRGLTVSLREHEFIGAARAMGASHGHVLARHVLPNVAGAAVVAGTVVATAAILLEAALSYVGFGIALPDTSLGLLISSSQGAAFTRPWLFLIPGGTLLVVGTAVNLVGDGIRDALAPVR